VEIEDAKMKVELLVWALGALVMLRQMILSRVEEVERHVDVCKKPKINPKESSIGKGCDYEDHSFWGENVGSAVFIYLLLGSVFWPVYFIVKTLKFIMFPRGVRTRYAKEKQLERRNAEAEKRILEAEERIRQTNAQISAGHIAIGVNPLECPHCKARELEITP
jgi:hypothetical protein